MEVEKQKWEFEKVKIKKNLGEEIVSLEDIGFAMFE